MTKYLITGGTGSLGRGLLAKLKGNITVFSRSETGQIPLKKLYPKVKFILGDVRDGYALYEAMQGIDVVIHAAAFKFINLGEVQARECVLTNVLGSINLIEHAKRAGVKKVVGISTDKVSYARNVYGCSKHIMEKLFMEANKKSETKFSIARYGNVMGTTGSVFTIWEALADEGKPLPLTDKRMTRFFMTIEEAVDLVLLVIKEMKGGEIFVKKMRSYYMYDLAKRLSTNIKITGLRPGEKLHETLIADYEGDEFKSDEALNFTSKGEVVIL